MFGEPRGFNLHVGMETIGWDCPYVLMIALWSGVFYYTRSNSRFGIRDLLGAALLVGMVIAAIQARVALVCTVFLNVATVILVAVLALICLRAFFARDAFARR